MRIVFLIIAAVLLVIWLAKDAILRIAADRLINTCLIDGRFGTASYRNSYFTNGQWIIDEIHVEGDSWVVECKQLQIAFEINWLRLKWTPRVHLIGAHIKLANRVGPVFEEVPLGPLFPPFLSSIHISAEEGVIEGLTDFCFNFSFHHAPHEIGLLQVAIEGEEHPLLTVHTDRQGERLLFYTELIHLQKEQLQCLSRLRPQLEIVSGSLDCLVEVVFNRASIEKISLKQLEIDQLAWRDAGLKREGTLSGIGSWDWVHAENQHLISFNYLGLQNPIKFRAELTGGAGEITVDGLPYQMTQFIGEIALDLDHEKVIFKNGCGKIGHYIVHVPQLELEQKHLMGEVAVYDGCEEALRFKFQQDAGEILIDQSAHFYGASVAVSHFDLNRKHVALTCTAEVKGELLSRQLQFLNYIGVFKGPIPQFQWEGDGRVIIDYSSLNDIFSFHFEGPFSVAAEKKRNDWMIHQCLYKEWMATGTLTVVDGIAQVHEIQITHANRPQDVLGRVTIDQLDFSKQEALGVNFACAPVVFESFNLIV